MFLIKDKYRKQLYHGEEKPQSNSHCFTVTHAPFVALRLDSKEKNKVKSVPFAFSGSPPVPPGQRKPQRGIFSPAKLAAVSACASPPVPPGKGKPQQGIFSPAKLGHRALFKFRSNGGHLFEVNAQRYFEDVELHGEIAKKQHAKSCKIAKELNDRQIDLSEMGIGYKRIGDVVKALITHNGKEPDVDIFLNAPDQSALMDKQAATRNVPGRQQKVLKRQLQKHLKYHEMREEVANQQFLYAKKFIELSLKTYRTFERKHLETVLVAAGSWLAKEAEQTQDEIKTWLAQNGPGLMPWDNDFEDISSLVNNVEARAKAEKVGEVSFYDWYVRRLSIKEDVQRDYSYACIRLSQPFLETAWRVERRTLDDYPNGVAYCSFEERAIIYNDKHLKEHIYNTLFHIQTACHEVAHALMYGAAHGPMWANLARALGDQTARALGDQTAETEINEN